MTRNSEMPFLGHTYGSGNMIAGVILEAPVVIQGGAIREASAAVHMCREVEAIVKALAIVTGAEVGLQNQSILGVRYLAQDLSQDPDLLIHLLDLTVEAKVQGACNSLTRPQ